MHDQFPGLCSVRVGQELEHYQPVRVRRITDEARAVLYSMYSHHGIVVPSKNLCATNAYPEIYQEHIQ